MSGSETSLIGALYVLLAQDSNTRHIVIPDLAASITLTAKAVAWNYGGWAQIAATVGTVDFWMTDILWQTPSAPLADYQIQVGSGGVGAEVGLVAKSVFGASAFFLPVRIAAGVRIAGRCASSTGAADTIAVKAEGRTLV